MFRVVFVIVGEILLASLNYVIYFHTEDYDVCIKEHIVLPQQNERMLRVCCLCIAAVVSFIALLLNCVKSIGTLCKIF